MLPSSERLRRANVFERAYKGRQAINTPIVTLYLLPKEGKRNTSWMPLVGFVVGKKVSKSAVKRNQARRRIREAYRLLRKEILESKDESLCLWNWYALVFVGRESTLNATYKEIEAAVRDALKRAASRVRRDDINRSRDDGHRHRDDGNRRRTGGKK